MSGENAANKKRKQRRSYNCGPCKRQKIKCDTCIPCSACVRNNRVDQCLAAPPNPSHDNEKNEKNDKKRVRKEGNSNEIRLPSIKEYTSTFKITSEIQPQKMLIPATVITPAISWDHSAVSIDKYTYSNRTTSEITLQTAETEVLKLRQEVKSLSERLAHLESKLTATSPLTDTHDMQKRKIQEYSSSLNDQFKEFVKKLPSLRPLETILNFYKTSLNSIMEILDSKVIDSAVKSISMFIDHPVHDSSPSSNTSISNYQWESLSLISMISSLTILQYPKNFIEQHLHLKPESLISYSNSLFQISKHALNAVKYRENPKLIHLRILLLFDRYLHLFIKKSLMLALGSELVSMSYVLGLQTLAIPQNSLEVEQAQKTWWIICHNDALKALRFQMPPLIRLEALSNGTNDHIGSDPGTSHILKAFISAENTSYQSIITHIAKVTKICNEIPANIRHSMVEFLENLIILDRQLTSYQIPMYFNMINSRNDISVSFQSCYLHFYITLSRFSIYKKIYFNNEQFSDQNYNGFINQSIWFIMLSIIESFLKKYSELRGIYPVQDQNNSFQYTQISEFLISGAIIHLIMEISPNSRLHPQSYKNLMKEYSAMLFEDLKYLKDHFFFNGSLPFYSQSFKAIEKLLAHQMKQELSLNSSTHYESFEVKQKRLQLSNELQSSKVLESMESNIGLVPGNEFFNQYIGAIVHLSRRNYNNFQSFDNNFSENTFQPPDIQQTSFQFPSVNSQLQLSVTSLLNNGVDSTLNNNIIHTNGSNGGSNDNYSAPVDNWDLSGILDQEQLELLNYLGL